jgi:dTDP-4-amino-4,6-dideoxygalactose transaminase
MIPYGKQDITQQDIDSVVDVLKSDFLTQGPQVPSFEKLLMRLTGAEHAVCVNSATSALHMRNCSRTTMVRSKRITSAHTTRPGRLGLRRRRRAKAPT